MYRLQENVPEYLINESRDFQLFCRLYDCLNNGVKFSIDSVVRVMNTTNCGSSFLKLLETRLGFFTDGQYTDAEIRDILFGFCDMVKYKGSILGIARAVRTFLVAKNLKVATKVEYDPKTWKVRIGIRVRNVDTSLLDDILRYVLPAGCFVDYYYYKESPQETKLEFGQRIIWIFTNDVNTSNLVGRAGQYESKFSNPTDNEKKSIDRTLSNIGFTNVYSVPDIQPSDNWEVGTTEDSIKPNNNIQGS